VTDTQQNREMTTSEILRIVDQIADAGCLSLTITGGEPLQREDWREIFIAAIQKGIFVVLFTNGTLIDVETVRFFEEWPPLRIYITIQAINELESLKSTGDRSAGKLSVAAASMLVKAKLPVYLRTVATKLNWHLVSEIKTIAEDLGCSYSCTVPIRPGINGSRAPCRQRVEMPIIRQLVNSGLLGTKPRMEEPVPATAPNLFNCPDSCTTNFRIDVSGKLCPCGRLREWSYDLLTGDFETGWRHFIPKTIAALQAKPLICADCELLKYCIWCTGWSWIENRDVVSPVDYLCDLAATFRDCDCEITQR
jgi:MoaA/NifB/PqqE/SkfB family radical SAM enzyme